VGCILLRLQQLLNLCPFAEPPSSSPNWFNCRLPPSSSSSSSSTAPLTPPLLHQLHPLLFCRRPIPPPPPTPLLRPPLHRPPRRPPPRPIPFLPPPAGRSIFNTGNLYAYSNYPKPQTQTPSPCLTRQLLRLILWFSALQCFRAAPATQTLLPALLPFLPPLLLVMGNVCSGPVPAIIRSPPRLRIPPSGVGGCDGRLRAWSVPPCQLAALTSCVI
jgi:hypothetical protein